MPTLSISNFQGINTQINPLELPDGNVIQALNVTSSPFGAVTKRPGYTTFLGTPDGSAVKSLFSWWRNDGTTLELYRASGSALYASAQGTGAWTLTANGTISPGAHFGHAVLNDVLIGGDGIGSTRHSTTGTSFTNTTSAPISQFFAMYGQQIYALGTGVAFANSTSNDATNWTIGGTSNSSTYDIGAEGSISYLFKNSDRVLFTTSGRQEMYQWDGVSNVDLVNDLGPSSPYSFDQSENLGIWLNRLGVYSYSGSAPQILSNSIQRLIYNNSGSGIAGTSFGSAPGVVHKYDYLCAVGSTTDDFLSYTYQNAILNYDIRLNNFKVWQFNDFPTAFHSYRDTSGTQQLVFGNASGQVFQLSGATYTDNGQPIESILQFVCRAGTLLAKDWYQYRIVMNPGCECKVEAAISNNFSDRSKNWFPLSQAIDGVVEGRFPTEQAQGKFLFIRLTDNSYTTPFVLFGAEFDYDIVERR